MHERYAAAATDAFLVRVALSACCSWFLLVRVRRRPRPPAARAARPAIGSGAATGRAAGRRWLIGRRCRGVSRGGCRASSSADPRGARVRERRPADRGGPARSACLDGLEGASPPRRLAAAATAARAGRPLRARSGPASSSTSTSRSSAASGRSASASSATASHRSRRAGWQYLHLAIDDHSRLAYAELLPSESPADCVAFLRRAVAWYREHGITVERVLTDNGNGYRSHAWASRLRRTRASRRRYTRPRRPQTNGKAEALVKTLLREWAYRFAYPSSAHRARALPGYLRWYNQHRPHSSLGGQPPITPGKDPAQTATRSLQISWARWRIRVRRRIPTRYLRRTRRMPPRLARGEAPRERALAWNCQGNMEGT